MSGSSYEVDGSHDLVDGAHTVEIVLEPETFSALCRRGRRRLRDIQATCPAVLRLDRSRGVLCVTGTAEAIGAVRQQIAGLGGPRKAISAAVWAELMRTRILQDGTEVLSRIQRESGCRIHIERRLHEVRLFGPPEATSIADELLDQFSAEVAGRTVELGNAELTEESLEAVAHSCGVTLRVEEGHVVVYGLLSKVDAAVQELVAVMQTRPKNVLPKIKQECEPTPESLDSRFKSDAEIFSMAPDRTKPPAALQPREPLQRRVPLGQQGGYQAMKHDMLQDAKDPQACPTCGCGQFCVSCGHPVAGWAYIQAPMSGQYVTMSNGQTGMFVPMMMSQPGMQTDGQSAAMTMVPMMMPQQGQEGVPQMTVMRPLYM
jgi:hypothetical protein